jgi:hypothetical protein
LRAARRAKRAGVALLPPHPRHTRPAVWRP